MLFLIFFFFARYLEAAEGLKPALINSFNSSFKSNSLISKSLFFFAPLITTVISPRTFFVSKKLIALLIVLPMCSSNFFVNSLAISISLSPPQT